MTAYRCRSVMLTRLAGREACELVSDGAPASQGGLDPSSQYLLRAVVGRYPDDGEPSLLAGPLGSEPKVTVLSAWFLPVAIVIVE
eukprot:846160-Pyramimonas_sp.AAC.1